MNDTIQSVVEQTVLKNFDPLVEIQKISTALKQSMRQLKKRGAVVAISGGIDSAVTAALCATVFSADKVFGLLLPEQDSSNASVSLGELLATTQGIPFLEHNIGPALDAIGCYEWRDKAIQTLFPQYQSDWKNKIELIPSSQSRVGQFRLVVQNPAGEFFSQRMDVKTYLQVVAATSYKQRLRKTVEYFHADRLNYAVMGTPNRTEFDQGFFVKNGDGSADIKPIAHLYKSEVYALARFMGLPEQICQATPTTDTYSLEQSQDDFYFRLGYQEMDVALWCVNQESSVDYFASLLSIPVETAKNIYHDIESKRRTTAPLHWKPLLVEAVSGPLYK